MNKKVTEILYPLDWVGKYFDGLAQATKDGKWFHVDKNEKPIYKEKWDWVSPAHKGAALAQILYYTSGNKATNQQTLTTISLRAFLFD